ncbi:triose-phosphate isomerase [Elioraea sp.]|uniref:triose-phosphate isomerase n=1 Tax=Elioraea sp. TaxID=2185103 RepID=UPI003F6F1B2C
MPRQLIAGNWKMNGLTVPGARLAGAIREAVAAAPPPCDLLICPPFTLVGTLAHVMLGSGVAVGAQDCHAKPAGAHTGDVSAPMLKDAGATAVILGHSERRTEPGEREAAVRATAGAGRAAGLGRIVWVGETLAEREAGRQEAVVAAQLAGSVPEGFPGSGVVAYEPVWAIGTGRTPTEADIAAMHAMIRRVLGERFGATGGRVPILYGGSVKPSNAETILALPEVGGALVGGASLVAEDFLAIAAAAA